MNDSEVKIGMRVKIGKLGETTGMLIQPRHLDCRKEGVTGTVKGWVPGHGGDVWWVAHDNSDDVGAYVFNEMEPTPNIPICVKTHSGKAPTEKQGISVVETNE
jgi:hypothetical protein